MTLLCPHCDLWHDGRVIKMCRDKRPWTNQERDARRDQMRRRYPAIHLVKQDATVSRGRKR